MRRIIKDDAIVEDDWVLLETDHQGELPAGSLLLPLKYWLENRENIDSSATGVWLNSDDDAASIGEYANDFPVIAINFPAFADGRGFSIARLLRERYGYSGEIRAIGDAIRDQLFYLKRCGFNAFDLGEQQPLEEALDSLNDFSVTYQSSVEQPNPLFRRQ